MKSLRKALLSAAALVTAAAPAAALAPAQPEAWNCGPDNCLSMALEALPAVDPAIKACLYPGPDCAKRLDLPAPGGKGARAGQPSRAESSRREADRAAQALIGVLGYNFSLSAPQTQGVQPSRKPEMAALEPKAKPAGPDPFDKVKLKQGPLQNIDTEKIKEVFKGSKQMSSN
ncbi:MAG: hypothetical protein HY921_04310 [Elusimicrobia bacterium]|nr:hypothetical protein [Elusimicrobiota bacterium]